MVNVVVLLNSPADVQRAYRDGIAAIDPTLAVDVINDVDDIDPLLPTMDVLMTYGTFLRGRSDEIFAKSPRLRWIQALGTGIDGLIPGSRNDIVVTSIRGIHDAAVSEAVFAMMLALSRDLPRSIRNQDRQVWDRQPSRLLDGKTVGILGVGLIGAALAPRCKAFGMKVVGITARTGRIDHFDELRPRSDLPAAVGDLDFLIVLAPFTAENRHLVNAAILSAMKPTSCLVNVARGGVIDEDALIDALTNGRIAGAALDVFATEPLPQGHPLWSMPNVIVTPHTAGMNVDYVSRALPFIRKNVAAFKAGDFAGMTGLVEQPKPQADEQRARSRPSATTPA